VHTCANKHTLRLEQIAESEGTHAIERLHQRTQLFLAAKQLLGNVQRAWSIGNKQAQRLRWLK